MLLPEKALEQIYRLRRSPELETCLIVEALGRVLVREIVSPVESPPFDKAAMDGYAVFGDEPADSYHIMTTIAAGDEPETELQPGQCSRIMTGAMIPPGADRVIRVEYTDEHDGIMRVTEPEPYRNIINRGENLRIGDPVLTPRVLSARDIGVLSSLGQASVEVARTPLVGVITTGSELKEPGEELGPGQIYNSNGRQLCAQIKQMGCRFNYYGTVVDDPSLLGEAIERGLSECDVLLLSGGVSMGSFDYVPAMLQEKSVEILFHKLAIKPGKPTLFGRRAERFVFGLPGNPVSTFVIFEVLVKPLLYALMGLTWHPLTISARLTEDINRRDSDRVEYRPVVLEAGEIHLISYHGSSHLNALSQTNALIRIDQGVGKIEKGAMLSVRLL